MDIRSLLVAVVGSSASDVFLTAGKAPRIRQGGLMQELDYPPFTADEINAFRSGLVSEEEEKHYRQFRDLDASCPISENQRFRLNFFETSSGPALVGRPIRSGNDLSLDKLGLPPEFADFAHSQRGLIIVVGTTGSGKSTTLGAMLNCINREQARHVITLEDPIEYLYRDELSFISQRELPGEQFAAGVRSAMRESPDVIVIGEMRDTQTVQAGISAALSGHLVLSTLHASDTSVAMQRIIDLYPESQRDQAAGDLGSILVAAIAQRLLPNADGTGMVAVDEVLVGTPRVRKLVADRDFSALDEVLKGGRENGMCSFNRAFARLVNAGKITEEDAYASSDAPEELKLVLNGMSQGSTTVSACYSSFDENENGLLIDMRRLLRSAIHLGASDILLSCGAPPMLRIDGDLQPLDLPALTPPDTHRLFYSLLSAPQKVQFEEELELDFALSLEIVNKQGVPESKRFRINGFHQRGSVGIVARVINAKIPSPEALNLPPQILRVAKKAQGLFLVTGPTGSGKSTTLASIIDQINASMPVHIVTMEDPIEYIHPNKMALVEQREVHRDTLSFSNALKYVLRQDPDVILIGELRDTETVSAALTAAETGHLVFGTLHTNSAPQTIDRIIDSFPAHQQNQVRQQLSGALLAVVSQRLLPRKEGKGRVAAFEIMIGTPPVLALIREGKINQIPSILETATKDGMITLRRYLEQLLQQGLINESDAAALSLEFKG